MGVFNRVIVAEDLSPMDGKLMAYTRNILTGSGGGKLYPTHVMPDFTRPENPSLAFHKRLNIDGPVDEKVEKIVMDQAEQLFADMDIRIMPEILEGQPFSTLLHLAEVKQIDLLVAGIKKDSNHSGITAKRLARWLPCNLLLVPEQSPANFNRIIIPIDFSDYSVLSINMALRLAQNLGQETEIELLNVARLLPYGYYYGIADNTEYRKEMYNLSQKDMDHFVRKNGYSGEQFIRTTVIDEADNVSRTIIDYTDKFPNSLLVIGARGHSPVRSFLLGSVAEGIIQKVKKTPVLMVRNM